MIANIAYGFLWKIVDVDDLILNAAGFWIAWLWYSRASAREAEFSPEATAASTRESSPA